MLRALALTLFVFSGPVPTSPATTTETIVIVVPAAIAANPAACLIR